jgi:plastocyanin
VTAYAADYVASTAGATANKRTGSASADTVPAGAMVLWVNAGAGTHVVTLTNSATNDGLAVANRTISIPATSAKAGRINNGWGDANGLVAVAIDGTAASPTT